MIGAAGVEGVSVWGPSWRTGTFGLLARVEPPMHADYPHFPGFLVDCPECMSRCYCDREAVDAGREVECVFHTFGSGVSEQ